MAALSDSVVRGMLEEVEEEEKAIGRVAVSPSLASEGASLPPRHVAVAQAKGMGIAYDSARSLRNPSASPPSTAPGSGPVSVSSGSVSTTVTPRSVRPSGVTGSALNTSRRSLTSSSPAATAGLDAVAEHAAATFGATTWKVPLPPTAGGAAPSPSATKFTTASPSPTTILPGSGSGATTMADVGRAGSGVGPAHWSPEVLAAHRKYLTTPAPGDGKPVRCYILRSRGMLGMSTPHYCLYEEAGDRFLCAARKRSDSSTSNYLIVMDDDPHAGADRKTAGSARIAGKLRSDWAGSCFMIYDEKLAPHKAVTEESMRHELGMIAFGYDTIGPGQMRIAVPKVSPAGVPVVFSCATKYTPPPAPAPGGDKVTATALGPEGSPLAAAANAHDHAAVVWLRNNPPKFNPVNKTYVLDFKGRVTAASVKNFQIGFDPDFLPAGMDPHTAVLQFGRCGKDKFILDFTAPLSPLQAFAIVLASLDPKVADTNGYESLRKLRESRAAATSGSEGAGGAVKGSAATAGGSEESEDGAAKAGGGGFFGLFRR